MLIASVLSVLLISASAPAGTAANSIIVTGRAIEANKAALASCLARVCPPDEDINASLALAETQLVAGKYREARVTLLAALSRNKKQAVAYPIPVSDLYRANGKVAAHLGIDDDYYRSTWGIYNTLKKGLPSAKDLQYSAMMEVAEMMATTRGHDSAREYYRSIAYHARQDGRPDIAALAELRMILRHWPAYAREKAVREIAESTDPKTRAAQLEARLALARMAFEKRDEATGDAIVSELAQYDIKKPILVYAPHWDIDRGPANADSFPSMATQRDVVNVASGPPGGADGGGIGTRGSQPGTPSTSPNGPQPMGTLRMGLNVEDMWVDVGFHIKPDGKVSDVQMLRNHGETGWARPLITSIAGRRYTPPRPGSQLAYRAERYTYTSGLEQGTASHGKQHSPNARVEYFDLSDIAAAN